MSDFCNCNPGSGDVHAIFCPAGRIRALEARAEKAEAALAELAEYRLSNDGRSLSIEKCSRTYQIAKRAAGRESGSPKG